MRDLKLRERRAFWVDILLSAAITFVSIVVASRIGFREAVRFARYEETRRARDVLRAVEREIAGNERALEDALADWDTDAFRNVHVVTSAFERASDSEEFFLLDAEATRAVTEAYGPKLAGTIADLRRDGGGRMSHAYARNLTFHLDLLGDARPLLAAAVARLDEELAPVLDVDLWRSARRPEAAPGPSSPMEEEAAARPPSRGWTRTAPAAYEGPLADLLVSQHLSVASLPRGPVILTFEASPVDRATPVALHVCFSAKAPFRRALRAGGIEDDRLRRLLGGDPGPDGFVLSHPWNGFDGQIVDPNRPAGWRYLYVLLEDESGARYPAEHLRAWKVGKDANRRFLAEASPNALVLPKGYLAR